MSIIIYKTNAPEKPERNIFVFCVDFFKKYDTVAAGNTTYHSVNNCIIKTSDKTLVMACNNVTEIPSDGSVEEIGPYALCYCEFVNLEIPSGVKHIGEYAFMGCNITPKNITMPTSVTRIDYGAFTSCGNLIIDFKGTKAEWEAIDCSTWLGGDIITINCTDGTVTR